jgi:transcription factor IIIB subunit 2
MLKLNNHHIDTAHNFFKMALTRNLTRGRKNSHIYAACVYMTCRTEETSHLLIDISDALQICCYELGRTYLKLSQTLNIKLPSIGESNNNIFSFLLLEFLESLLTYLICDEDYYLIIIT